MVVANAIIGGKNIQLNHMIKKLKKTLKKEKGLKARLARQEFLHALKNGKPKQKPETQSAQDILQKIRDRNSRVAKTNPYNAGEGGMMAKLKKALSK